MSERRADRRRADRRAFRPTVDGQLEARKLMTVHTYVYPPGHIQTAFNGSAVDITTPQGQSFYVSLTNVNSAANIGAGQIRAYSMGGGRYGLVLYGTSNQSQLAINPVVDHRFMGTAHEQNTRQAGYTNMLNIGAITVVNGMINSVVGYKTAVLSGPLVATSPMAIDRIAFEQILPGASILTGGDLNTLDVYDSVVLSGTGTGIVIGRDLNYFNGFGNLTISNGAVLNVGRAVGLNQQLAKGTGPGPGSGINFQGTIVLSNGGRMILGGIAAPTTSIFTIDANGGIIGASNITVLSKVTTPFAIGSPVGVLP